VISLASLGLSQGLRVGLALEFIGIE